METKFKTVVSKDINIGMKDNQEDNFFMSDSKFFVFDGVGGHPDGEIASELACKHFQDYFIKNQTRTDTSIQNELRNLAVECDNMMYSEERKRRPGRISSNPMGTTVAGIIIEDDVIYTLSCGDSLLYWISRDGELTQLNTLHEIVIDKRPYITQFLGYECKPESRRGKISERGGSLVIATDGLETLDKSQVANIVHTGFGFETTAPRLVRKALERNLPKQDNITVIVAHLIPET